MAYFRGLFCGLTTVDIQHFVSSFPVANKKIKSLPPEIFIGGPATNAAVAFSCLNGNAFLASATGTNSFSKTIEDDFMYTNIVHYDLAKKQEYKPVIASVVTSLDNGDRNIFTHHPERIQPTILPGELLKQTKPQIILADGFYPEFSIELLRQAYSRNIPVVLDCGSWKNQYETMLEFVDTVICSEDFLPPQCSSASDVFKYLKSKNVKYAAISRGNKNILYWESDTQNEIDIEPVEVKDTLGAGDFLHGAFCFYWLQLNNFRNALQQATKLASYTCQFKGTRGWLNFYREVKN